MSRDLDNGFEEWGGYMDAKIKKLEEQVLAVSDTFRQTNLFAGISIFVNGYTKPSADELKRIMMVHGGTYHHYERSHTTYIIASNLPDVKVRNMNTSKIISPQWVVDCLQEERIVDYTRYLLYTNQRSTQPSLDLMLKKTKTERQNADAAEPAVLPLMQKLQVIGGKILHGIGYAGAAPDRKPPITAETKAQLEASENSLVKNLGEYFTGQQKKTIAAAGNVAASNVARSAVDPNFISEFYSHSRLHHVACLGSGFKDYIYELRQKYANAGFPCRAELRRKLLASGFRSSIYTGNGCVMHIDMDCFFVSVGLRKHPHLRGLPVAVTHSKGGSSAFDVPVHPNADRQAEKELFATRFEAQQHNNNLSDKVRFGFDNKLSLSEIASCSYEARALGITNGMYIGHALNLCPELKTIPYDFEFYREVAFTLYDTVIQYTLDIEAVSCDEMFVNLSDILAEIQFPPMLFVEAVRNEVRLKTGCPCSAGVGANKLQARLATKRAKPNGQYHLKEEDVAAFLADMPISELPGVGFMTAYSLKQRNLVTCTDLQNVSLANLKTLMGNKQGEKLHKFCRGIDDRPLNYDQLRKSVSAEINYGIRFKEYSELETFLRQVCTEVHTRLKDIQRKTKCITLKLMVRSRDAPLEASKFMGHGVCDHVTKSVSLSSYTDDLQLITRTALTTMKALALTPNELRGIGIQLTKLDDPNKANEKKENVIKNMFTAMAEKKTERENSSGREPPQPPSPPSPPPPPPPPPPPQPPHVPPAKFSFWQQDYNTHMNDAEPTFENMPFQIRKAMATKNPKNTKRSKKQKKLSNNILRMVANVSAKRSSEAITKSITNNYPQCPPEVDATVFVELPYDIRVEIWNDYVQRNKPCIPNETKKTDSNSELSESDLGPSTSKAAKERLERQKKAKESTEEKIEGVDEEFLLALPPDIRAEVEMQLKDERLMQEPGARALSHELVEVTSKLPDSIFSANDIETIPHISVNNIFAQPKCVELLLEWVQSCDVPDHYDVYLVCIHAKEFVRNKCIEQLYDPLMYLCSLINSHKSDENNDCSWHAAYNEIVESVQIEMRTIYEGRKLLLGVKLNCDKCCLT